MQIEYGQMTLEGMLVGYCMFCDNVASGYTDDYLCCECSEDIDYDPEEGIFHAKHR